MTEHKAKSLNKEIKVGKFPLSANGKALALGEDEGFIKTLFDAKTGEILGAHMIGPEVTELINTFSLAMKLEATEADIMNTVFPHPTLSEAIHLVNFGCIQRGNTYLMVIIILIYLKLI